MKKILALCLVLSMLAAMTGCGASDTKKDSSEPAAQEQQEVADNAQETADAEEDADAAQDAADAESEANAPETVRVEFDAWPLKGSFEEMAPQNLAFVDGGDTGALEISFLFLTEEGGERFYNDTSDDLGPYISFEDSYYGFDGDMETLKKNYARRYGIPADTVKVSESIYPNAMYDVEFENEDGYMMYISCYRRPMYDGELCDEELIFFALPMDGSFDAAESMLQDYNQMRKTLQLELDENF